MTGSEWSEVWRLLQLANEVSPDQRRELLATAPPHIAEEVAAMLAEGEAEDPEPPAPGRTYGRYTLVAPLGSGGMGEVYSARDGELGRTVAIKFVGARARLLPAARERLIREAQAASTLNHPHLVTVHEVLRFESGVALVTELVNGQSLRVFTGVARPIGQVALWGAQIARALAAAHAGAIVHSDIKPENIMLRPDGYIKILDFGLAQSAALGVGIDDLPLGTLGYMSPEQTRGETLTGASDVFSLGVTLVELATGKHPFRASTARATTLAIAGQEVPYAPPDLPGGNLFAALLRAMLDKDSARRPGMAEVADRLERVAASTSRRRRPLWWGVGAGAALMTAAIVWLWSGKPVRMTAPVQITTYSGIEHQPAFSPDGSRLAFVWSGADGLQDDLYVRAADRADDAPRRLTSDAHQEFSPAWSPDGKYLAWRRRLPDGGEGELWVMPVNSLEAGEARKVATTFNDGGFHGLAWTPDSSALISRDTSGRGYPLYRISLADGTKTAITDEPDMQDYQPKLSPDGKRLLFFRYNISRPQLCFMEFGPPAALPVCREIRIGLRSATWTLDSRGILLQTEDALWLVDAAADWAMTKLADGVFSNLTTDAAGGRYAFNRTITDANILQFDVPSQRLAKLISSSEEDSEPHFSPDGSKVLFRSQRTGHFELYVCNRNGEEVRQLTHLASHCGSARWSPDGQWIAYDSVQEFPGPAGVTKFDNVYVMPAAGGAGRRLTDDRAGSVVPNWSADSRSIYYSRDKNREAWKVPLEGGASVQIDRHEMWGAVESADGRWVWYEQPTTGKGLWRRPVDGGVSERVPGTENLTYRTWELRGDLLVFLRSAPNPGFWRMNVADGLHSATRLVAPAPRRLLLGPGTMSISRDGNTILYTSEDVSVGDIYFFRPDVR